MSKRRADEKESRLTPTPRSTVPPRSGSVRRLRDWTEQLVALAAELPADLPLEAAAGQLLAPMQVLEEGAGITLVIALPGREARVVQRGVVRSVPTTPAAVLSDRDCCAAAVPGLDGSALVFWAPAYVNAPREHYQRMIEQAAAVVALVVRRFDTPGTSLDTSRLAHLEKLATIGQTAAEIVHELNNPLTAILAYSEYLGKRLGERGVADADVDRVLRIYEAASRIQHFCRDLTDYSRPASALRTPVDLQAVIDRGLRFCMHGLRSANITVERVYRDVPRVMAVESALTQVLVNLITNASQAMAVTGGTLSLRTSWRGPEDGDGAGDGWALIQVADEGHGISEAHRPKIFDLYFTTKPDGAGVGLGLAIVRQIVEAHQGRIRVDAREPRGTVFSIELPIARDSLAPAEPGGEGE